MSYPELLLSGGHHQKKYSEVIENISPNIFHQYLERLSKVSKAKNLSTLRRELEEGCIAAYPRREMLSMDMLNVGEYIIAFEPRLVGPAEPTSLMLIIPIERIDVGEPGRGVERNDKVYSIIMVIKR